jgi:hypothetical protein
MEEAVKQTRRAKNGGGDRARHGRQGSYASQIEGGRQADQGEGGIQEGGRVGRREKAGRFMHARRGVDAGTQYRETGRRAKARHER